MGRTKVLCGALVLVIFLATVSSGCLSTEDDDDGKIKPGKLVTEDEEMELGSADSVEVYLEQNVGDLYVSGGASKLMEATFRYNVDKWKPEVTYREVGGDWNLSVVQPNTHLQVATGARNEWDISLDDDVPIEFVANVGVGSPEISIGGLNLQDVDVNIGVGDLDLRLGSYDGDNLTVDVHTGVGDVTIRVPSGMGVRVIAVTDVGTISATGFTMVGAEYHSSDYDVDQPHIVVTAMVGTGDITIVET
ncbi:MAG: hypothetical protein GWN18_04665 [Thermoplasmata archaeon]|nr:hypothetical protein [Thermoplasmata archaeon]NIS19256.1 hypothetical protein [Thermoplasmata archaeon]NIT76331.1 hypothetical protein [Thermoplasmata archaeon]NIU48391.1 hypothetical protein [Thermoplasmata archaeon]NIV78019.1 hypothetical protein [Thermoplasmata archaeon]